MMIYRMGRNLETALRARKFPLKIEYGPEAHAKLNYPSGVIVLERDSERGDSALQAPRGTQRNPRKSGRREIGCVATIYGASTTPGARRPEHEGVCDTFVDAFLAELEKWAKLAQIVFISVDESRYLSAAERSGEQTWPGVVYRVRFRVPRTVFDRDYTGAAEPTGSPAHVSNRTEVRIAGEEGAGDPDVGCGA